VLDLEMPRMDGISFLRRLMHHYPLPVVVCSSLATDGAEPALRALDAGAFAVVCKPTSAEDVPRMAAELLANVRAAAAAKDGTEHRTASMAAPAPEARRTPNAPARAQVHSVLPAADAAKERRGGSQCRIIAVGASTGGTVAVETIVRALPTSCPPVVIVQHLPPYICGAFVRRLDQIAPLHVEEARDGQKLEPGVALVAPGDRHVLVERRGGQLYLLVRQGARVSGHRPSVDVLFRSTAEAAEDAAIGVLLTGMGRDGAEGLLAMRAAGAHTLVQDEASSTVWGMPKAALDVGAADEVVPLDRMAGRLNQITQHGARRSLRADTRC
jgi:two-component system chemotaxis response regulator CheB